MGRGKAVNKPPRISWKGHLESSKIGQIMGSLAPSSFYYSHHTLQLTQHRNHYFIIIRITSSKSIDMAVPKPVDADLSTFSKIVNVLTTFYSGPHRATAVAVVEKIGPIVELVGRND
jgi:hypothetical protein